MKHKGLKFQFMLALALVLLLTLVGTAAAQEPEPSDHPPPDLDSPPQLESTPIASVVIIGGYTLDWGPCSGSGNEANNMGRTFGGCLPVSGFTGLDDFSFTPMDHTAVSAASLAPFDIAVLNVASSRMACNTGNLTSQQKADLVAFAASGKKLIIFDSECWPQDYSWLPFPFTTANPGAMGAPGSLTIVEENTLSSNDSANPYYIDANHLGHYTDAVGDMNVMTTFDPNWCVDMSGTNFLNVTGPVHTYAKYPSGTDVGLIIYNGLDQDYQGYGINDPWLRKTWLQELKQPVNPSNLPCGFTVVGITLAPLSASNPVGSDHTLTAKLTDLLGNPQPNIAVTFTVTAGPNVGTSGSGTTDANGEVSFTYTGAGGVGTDSIEACFTDQGGNYICSQTASKEWTNRPPTADPNGPYVFPLDTGPFDGTGSSDPDGDPLTYAWDFGDGDHGTGATPTHTYADAGIYDVCLTVNDGYVDSVQECTIAVVYDPSAGFVTGGGWIDSPEGAYVPDPDLVGKATFGFVSKYKKGADTPTGNTEFQFHAASLNFHSDSYEWLVVTGSNYARFKGVGTINGEGAYKFMLWAGDGDPDTFRIKIWTEDDPGSETVVYDNGSHQAIGGGSIVVHSGKK